VLPVAGLLAQAGATLREDEFRSLAALAEVPADKRKLLLASADRFVAEDDEVELPIPERINLVNRLGLFGVRLSVELIASGEVTESGDLAQQLIDRSGVEALRKVLMSQFASRRELLKARAALVVVHSVIRDDRIADAEDLEFDLERIEAGAHEFTELRLFNSFRAGAVVFREAEVEEVDRLLGANGMSPSARLGLPDDATTEQLQAALYDTIDRWRRRAESPMTNRDVADAAQVIVRSCEGILQALSPEAAVA
jgi:hypothetical protein